MELPIVMPAPVVTEHAGVFRDLFENQCQFRHFQHYLTGLMVLPNKSMANIARCILDSADKTNLSRFLSEAPWREDAINRRRIRFMLQQTKPHRRRRHESLIAIDDTLREHVGTHSIGFRGGGYPCSSKASRGEDLDIEEPVACRDCSSFDFYPTLPGMQGATLGGHQVVQMGQPSKKRLLAASWMVKALHREKFPLNGVMGLIQQGAHHGHLRVFAHRIPPRLLVLKPAPDVRPVSHPGAVSHVIGNAA